MAKEKLMFPRNVYKSPGDIQWNSDKSYSTELVADEREFDAAIKAGYKEDFHAALFEEKKKKVEDDF